MGWNDLYFKECPEILYTDAYRGKLIKNILAFMASDRLVTALLYIYYICIFLICQFILVWTFPLSFLMGLFINSTSDYHEICLTI